MAAPFKRGQSSNQVTNQFPSTAKHTPSDLVSTVVPHGLRLQQTILSSGSVTIPDGVTWVYVVMTGAGGGGFFGYASRAGEVSWGWTLAQNTCIIGAGAAGSAGGYSRYGHIIAKGGNATAASGDANYYGIPGGTGFGDGVNTAGQPGSNGGRAGGASSGTATGFNGGDGISGGGGAQGSATTGTSTGGNGGSGLAGGGGGTGAVTTNTRIGGNGGNGLGIDGTIYTGGTGSTGTNTNGAGGGGAGIAGNGSNAVTITGGTGGLGGGGAGAGGSGIGGAGILYIFY